MYVFSNLDAARQAGFYWFDFDRESGLHIVESDRLRSDGRREKSHAFARQS